MWLSRSRYDTLIRAEERAEMLVIRVNQLEQELKHERYLRTGEPQRVTELRSPNRKKPERELTPEESAIAQIEQGLEIFEDVGDSRAGELGLDLETDGRLALTK